METAALMTAATVEEDVFALMDAIAFRIDKAIRLYRTARTPQSQLKLLRLIARRPKSCCKSKSWNSIDTHLNKWLVRSAASVCSEATAEKSHKFECLGWAGCSLHLLISTIECENRSH